MVDMQYVFEIRDIPRNMRKYYKVRYSFKTNLTEEIEPDWEGDTYKYVIGTSYTALELLIVNKRVKGPCWIKISKDLLSENHHNTVEVGLCADMKFPEQI
jgi:DNA polymerase alpha subunit A